MKTQRNYPLLLGSQFLSAFGDNAILAVILGPVMAQFKTGQITAQQQSIDNIFYTSLLFIPYVFLAPLAGYLNDRFPKTHWLFGGNIIKLVGTVVAGLSLWGEGVLQAIGYFVVGIGACVYSPAKYGILPEIVAKERLVKANGTVEFLTLIAILVGNIAGALMIDNLSRQACFVIVAAIYGGSMLLNCFMARTPSYPEVHLGQSFGEFAGNMRDLFSRPRLVRVLFGTGLFWICGALMKMNFQPWGQQVLKLETMTQISLRGLWLSIGVMAGSMLAGQLYPVGELRATRRYGWLLAISVAVLGGVQWLLHHGFDYPRGLSISVLVVAGLFAGLFLIPLNAALQAESNQGKLGKTIATQNGIENAAMLIGGGFAYVNVRIGFDPSQLFLGLAALVAVVSIWLKIPQRGPDLAKSAAVQHTAS